MFAPADRRWPGRSGSASGSEGQGAVAAARAALRGRLETVQKVLTHMQGQCRDKAAGTRPEPGWSQRAMPLELAPPLRA